MTAEPVPFTPAQAGVIMEQVLIRGDLASLTHQERARYYIRICESLGLNPMTKPFEYLQLNGKLVLYALKACTDQLRKLHGVSIAIVSHEEHNGLFTVHVRAKDRDGREDEDFGVVSLPETSKGEVRANTILKAVTKAKRRVTLSLCGLGFLDETEVEDIPASAKQAVGENSPVGEIPECAPVSVPAPAKPFVPARIQRNLDRLAPKPGGVADRAMVERAQREWRRPAGPSKPFLASQAGKFDERNQPPHDGTPDFAAKEINRRLHPMKDELPDHSAPPKDSGPEFLDRRKSAEPSYLSLVGAE